MSSRACSTPLTRRRRKPGRCGAGVAAHPRVCRAGRAVPGDRTGLFGEARGGSASATESLGTRTIEGLEAEGTRTTITIPAGEAGNEMPLEIVSERWVSKELQVSVLMRFVDPRMGERIHRLTSIARGEPSPQLFVVPADFKTVDGPERLMHPQRVP